MLSQDLVSVDRGLISDKTCRLVAAVQCGVWEPLPDRTYFWWDISCHRDFGREDRGRELFLSLGDGRDCGAWESSLQSWLGWTGNARAHRWDHYVRRCDSER